MALNKSLLFTNYYRSLYLLFIRWNKVGKVGLFNFKTYNICNSNDIHRKNYASESSKESSYDPWGYYALHKPGENYKAKGYITTKNTLELLKEHLKITGGQVRTRFPPEPNGILHIGHCKAINIDFLYARHHNGICILRFDDTNPETVNKIYTENIQDLIQWLGFKPSKVTYASDYFVQLYEWAKELIMKDLAFVCHIPQTEDNYNKMESLWRNMGSKESLQEFENMRAGKYKEGEATLRLKMTTEQQTVDPVIYRIKYKPHHRTGSKWCIYPTYDFAHCLCDSIEHITHSFCTTEFTLRRSTYYWICNALDVYCPVQSEFGRLNFLYSVTSKRKILQLIEAGHIKDWDDPRLFTLSAMRRRGFPVEAINRFCQQLSFNQGNIYVHPQHLYFYVREVLNRKAKRVMCVLNPLRVVITNYPYEGPVRLKVQNIPEDETSGFRSVIFHKELWIESEDFKPVGEKGYRRLTPLQVVGLKHSGHIISLEEVVKTPEGAIDHLKVTLSTKENSPKPRAFIHWVSHPVSAQIRIYDYLFNHQRPDDLEGGFLSDLNPNSVRVLDRALVERSLLTASIHDQFQFERCAYFCLDRDSSQDKLIFNKIVDIRQHKGFHQTTI